MKDASQSVFTILGPARFLQNPCKMTCRLGVGKIPSEFQRNFFNSKVVPSKFQQNPIKVAENSSRIPANGFGYGAILIIVASIREILGFGTFLNMRVLPEFLNNGLMILAPGAFIILGLIIWAQRTLTSFVEE